MEFDGDLSFYGFTFLLSFLIALSVWSYKRRRTIILPPGSQGFPFIGETLQLIKPSYSIDLPFFIRSRVKKYGKIFQTRIVGRPMVMSTDQDFNKYCIQQEGRSVELWYLDTFSKFFSQEGENRTTATGALHKYVRGITLKHFGTEILKKKLVNTVEDWVTKGLENWSSQESINVKDSSLTMALEFAAAELFGYDKEKSKKFGEKFAFVARSVYSFPINVPGTTYYKCIKTRKEVLNVIRAVVKEKLNSPESYRDDFVDHFLEDLNTQSFLSEEFVAEITFGLMYVSSEATSLPLTTLFKLLGEHPHVLDELMVEHERILKNRENPGFCLTYDEVKSMTFTHMVINESLRLGNGSVGLLRRATKDIQYKGFTIPTGWTIMLVTSACHYNPDIYTDPLVFNPWRWKDLAPDVVSKNFMPFGGGTRQCSGAEFGKMWLAIFLHVMITKFRWRMIKGGQIMRTPVLAFKDGVHIKVDKKKG